MSEIENRKVENGILTFDLGGLAFRVSPHPGRDGVRTARLVRKLSASQLAHQVSLLKQIERRMSASEREHLADLREQIQALEGSKGPEFKRIEAEMQKLLSKYEDQELSAQAYAQMQKDLNLDHEAILDELVFKHAKVRIPGFPQYQALNEPNVFDLAFQGENAELVDRAREEIVNFNGFLGKPAEKPETETTAAATP